MQQQELPGLVGEIPQVEPAPLDTVLSWKDEHEAIMWCLDRLFKQRPGLSREDVAEYIGVAKGTFTKVCQGQLGLSAEPRRLFQNLCGTIALEQYQLLQFGFVAMHTRKQTELTRELEDLKLENRRYKKMFVA